MYNNMRSLDMFSSESKKKVSFTINLTSVGIAIFVLNVSLLHTFVSSRAILVGGLAISFALIVLGKVMVNNGITITKIDVVWLCFLFVFIINILFKSELNRIMLLEIFVFASSILFLIISKSTSLNYNTSLKIIKYLGIFYALGVLFQYYFEDYYMSYIFNLFPSGRQDAMIRLINNNAYFGFTNQTAHTAGYIINGLSILLFFDLK